MVMKKQEFNFLQHDSIRFQKSGIGNYDSIHIFYSTDRPSFLTKELPQTQKVQEEVHYADHAFYNDIVVVMVLSVVIGFFYCYKIFKT